jgi:EAL domain-containing protein (putative c-di-GMP-specific phosphodiesterase class I)
LGLAKGFGFHTVAEGVETAGEAAILHREGIGYLQGYYYGRPSLDRPWLKPPANAAAKMNGHDLKRAAAGD